MTTFRYLTAQEWGMTWARPPQPEQRQDPEAYIHHAGGAAWMHDDAVTVFRQLNTYAQQGKGYAAVDYDILVHYSRSQDVVTIGGARQEWMSAATRDRNELGEAICLCADTEERQPLAVEVEGIALAVVYGIGKGWIAKDAVILGHRDNPAHPGATACPGRFLYPQLPTIRARVDWLLNPPPPPPPPLEDDMAVIAAKLSTNGSFWFTPNGGVNRVWVNGADYARNVAALGMVDAKTGTRTNTWDGIAPISEADLERLLGPRVA